MVLKSVFFDLDGTLLDTAPDFVYVLNTLLEENAERTLEDARIRATVSSGAKALIKLGFGIDEDHHRFEPLRLRLLELYSKHLADKSTPFPGILETLNYLQQNGIRWGVVTNKPLAYTQPLLNAISFPVAAAAVVCPDHTTHRKPHPEPLYLACKQTNCLPSEAIYLGDHQRDIDAGKNAGMRTIACNYGYIEEGEDPEIWQADHIVNHGNELIPLLQKYIQA
ncbi:MAG: HAD-IA family hydrolase [Pseudomonadales bacterium]|nr:HAD-IA family hydrolase [Pseudomonadales bacterium]